MSYNIPNNNNNSQHAGALNPFTPLPAPYAQYSNAQPTQHTLPVYSDNHEKQQQQVQTNTSYQRPHLNTTHIPTVITENVSHSNSNSYSNSNERVVDGKAIFTSVTPVEERKGDNTKKIIYNISLKTDEMDRQTISKAFSELRTIHFKHYNSSSCNLPDFPSRHVFWNMSNPENIKIRAKELFDYFNNVVKMPDLLLKSRQYLIDLSFPIDFIDNIILYNADLQLKFNKYQLQIAEMHRQQQQLELENRMKKDQDYAQNYLQFSDKLQYDHKINFFMKEQLFGFGNATILGPNKQPWFKITRTNPSFFHWAHCQFMLTNLKNEPVALLQEQWGIYKKMFTIFVVRGKDYNNRSSLIKAIEIEKMTAIGAPFYSTISHIGYPCSIHGSFGDYSTAIKSNNRTLASFSRNIISITDEYNVSISANTDIALVLSIACVVDKMHHKHR